MKQKSILCIVGLFFLIIGACEKSQEINTESKVENKTLYQWKMQSSEPSGTTMFQLEAKWIEDLEKLSDGQIKIELLPPGSVVPVTNMLDAASTGVLQMYSADPSFFSGKNPFFAMIGNLVGAWDDPWLVYDFMKFNGGEKLYNEVLESYGVHLIGSTFFGVESIVSTKPLASVKDFKNLKIRAPQGLVSDVMSKLGASPVNLPGSEVFTALQKGIVDAADYNSFAVNYQGGLYDIGKYTNYPGIHSLPMHSISMNKELWDSLPENIQTMMEVSLYKLNYELIETIKYQNDQAISEVKNSGKDIIISNWSNEEKIKFRSIAQEAWKEWAGKNETTKKFYDQVIDYMQKRNLIQK